MAQTKTYKSIKITRRLATLRQIHAAIEHLQHGQWEAAITLALAAEGQLPHTEKPYLFKMLRERAPDLASDGTFNLLRDWLKHSDDDKPDEIEISVYDVAIALMRATTKFYAVYGKTTLKIKEFEDWCRQEGYADGKTKQSS